MLMKDMYELQVLAIAIMCWAAIQGHMEQQSCSKLSPPTSSSSRMTTRYAPSLITCSFLCRDNSSCNSYSYSNKQCTLYWLTAASAPSATGWPTCTTAKKACPETINNGQYSCFLLSKQNTCYCMSSASMTWDVAGASCFKYGMKLLSVETAEENAFVRGIIISEKVAEWCVWTSAQRTGFLQFKWNSTNQAVDIDINRSSYLDNLMGDCLMYSKATPPEPWLWDDWHCSSECVNMCEFTPLM